MITEIERQIKEVYKLWLRAMAGDWRVYFKYFAYTVDNHEEDDELRMAKPLINDKDDEEWMMPFLELIFEAPEPIKHIVKSRQQRVSLIMTHVCLYNGLRKNNWLIMLQSTKKINKADELFDKQKKAYNRLPPWSNYMKINTRDGINQVDNGTKFTMLSEDSDDSAGYTFNMFYFDEMSLHPKAHKVVGVCLPGLGLGKNSTDRSFISSSSPRKDSYHVQLSVDEEIKETKRWIIRREWSGKGLATSLNKRGHRIIELHYSANPKKNKEWADTERKDMEQDQWEREYELNPDAVEGDKVFKTFNKSNIKTNLIPYARSVMIRAWDFGKFAGVTWSQYDRKEKIYRTFDELLQPYSDARKISIEVNEKTDRLYNKFGLKAHIIDVCDPYHGKRYDFTTGSTVMAAVEEAMMDACRKRMRFACAPRMHIEDRVELCRAVIRQGVEIDDMCTYICKALGGSYVLKSKKNEPNKDNFYEHIMDAWMYGMSQIFSMQFGKGLVFIPEGLYLPGTNDYGINSNNMESDVFDGIEGIEVFENGKRIQ